MSRLGKTFVVAAFITWLAIPLVLIGLGVESGFAALEKRSATSLPELSIGGLTDPELTSRLAASFGDRVPLRVEALALKAWLDINVLGDSPNPSVLLGAEGWLFHRQSVLGPRRPAAARQSVETIRRVSRILQASGRRLVLVVAPNKDAIYPERLGPSEPLAQPGLESRQRIRALLQSAELPGYIDLWQALERLKATADGEVYWPQDTHWTSRSVLEASRLIVDVLDPTLWDEGVITAQPDLRRGDLAQRVGLPTWERGIRYGVRRNVRVEGAAVPASEPMAKPSRLSTTGEDALFGSRVLVIYDSFGNELFGILPSYLAESTWIAWSGLPKERLTSIVDEFARAEIIVLETVERAFIGRFSKRARGFTAHLVGRLLDELPVIDLGLPPSLASNGWSLVVIDLPATVADDRYLVVDLEPSVDEAAVRQIRIEAKGIDGIWRHVPRRVLISPRGGWRAVAELPPATTAVRIQQPALPVR